MSGILAFIGAHRVGTALASVLLVVGATQVGGPDDRTATVTRVVDGDTVDVSYEGDTHRVRLLNIDTPETVHPDEPVECMGPEATAFLRRLLPQGTTVRLRYDDERTDRYGRELAGVFVKDQLVNAEIARAGLAAAIVVGGNDRYYERVRAAQDEAMTAGRGLFGSDVACTLPAQVTGVQASSETVSSAAAPVDDAGLAALEAEIAVVTSRLEALRTLVRGNDAKFPLRAFRDSEDRRVLDEQLDSVDANVEQAQQQLATARTAVEQRRLAEQAAREAAAKAAREAAEKAAREAAQRAAREAEEAAARAASAKAAREAAAAEAARRARDSAPRSSTSGGRSSSGGSSGGSTGGYDGYTGCRAYGPNGTSIDEKGRRYTKISC